MSDSQLWYKIIKNVPRSDDYDYRMKRECSCSCGRQYYFFSQEDKNPELYTFVTQNCICGALIKMKFPVN